MKSPRRRHVYTYKSLQPYIERIMSGNERNLHPDSVAVRLPSNSIFLFFDTETTGLNKNKNDSIHELAMIATDRSMNEIETCQIKAKVPDHQRWDYHLQTAIVYLRDVFSDEEIKKIFWAFIRRLVRAKNYNKKQSSDDKVTELSSYHVLYNFLCEYISAQGMSPGDRILEPVYKGLLAFIRAYEYYWVLKLTKYDHGEIGRLENDKQLSDEFVAFTRHLFEVHRGKDVMTLVGQNVGFDIVMVSQTMMVGGGLPHVEYSQLFDLQFLDTAMMMRKYINKYNLIEFIYHHKQWQNSARTIVRRDEDLANTAMRYQPIRKNKLGYVSDFFDIPNEAWHTALNDVRVTVNVMKTLLAYDLMMCEVISANPEMQEIKETVENMKSSPARYLIPKKHFESLKTDIDQNRVDVMKLADIIEEIEEKSEEGAAKKIFKEQNFVHQTVDPYRRHHVSLYKKFLSNIGIDEESDDFEFNEPTDENREEEFKEKIEKEFPGAATKIFIPEEWKDKSII